MKINFFEYSKLYTSERKNFIRVFDKVCSKGAFILQNDLEMFEKKLSQFQDIKYAVGVNDGTTALILSLIANGVKSGDEVILPSHTYIASAASIKLIGAKPVLADISLKDNLINPNSIIEKVSSRTKAIMPVHVNGRVCRMDEINKIAKLKNLKIIEDGAQSIGAKYKGKSSGHYGNCTTISFYPAKVLGCFGDGGAVLTNDKKIYKKIMLLRDHGRDKSGNIKLWGFNARLDNIQAAFLNFKIRYLKREITKRRSLAKLYNKNLSGIKDMTLPPAPTLNSTNYDVYQNYEIRANKRDALMRFLFRKGIKAIPQWSGKALHHIKSLKFKGKALNNTDIFFKQCLMLPMHTFLKKEDIIYITQVIKSFYKHD